MKTAMELALARIEMLYIEKDSIHWEMFKNDCMEKEKKQIIDAYSIGFLVSKDLNMIKPSFNVADDYYNQAYNQNK
jgi:hypothetical protein